MHQRRRGCVQQVCRRRAGATAPPRRARSQQRLLTQRHVKRVRRGRARRLRRSAAKRRPPAGAPVNPPRRLGRVVAFFSADHRAANHVRRVLHAAARAGRPWLRRRRRHRVVTLRVRPPAKRLPIKQASAVRRRLIAMVVLTLGMAHAGAPRVGDGARRRRRRPRAGRVQVAPRRRRLIRGRLWRRRARPQAARLRVRAAAHGAAVVIVVVVRLCQRRRRRRA